MSDRDAYSAVVFDFDLTLADSSAGFVDCHRFAAERLGLAPPDPAAVKRTIGTPLPIVVPRLYGDAVGGRVEQYVDVYQARADAVMTGLTVMLDGAAQAVHALRASGLQLGIVSQKLRYRVEDVLRRESLLECFDAVIGAEDAPDFKPDPRGLLAAVSRLDATPAATLYVGDTVIDAEAAHRAGMPFVGVLTGATTRADFAAGPSVALLDSVRDLPAWLAARGSAG